MIFSDSTVSFGYFICYNCSFNTKIMFSETQIEDQRLGYPVDSSSAEPSSVPPSIPLIRIPPTESETTTGIRPAPITVGQIIQETSSHRSHLIGYPSSGHNGQSGLDGQVRQSVLSNHYSKSSELRTETINTDPNDNVHPTLNLRLDGQGLPGSSAATASQFDETPRSPDSVQSAFQKRIQDTLISTAERQLESFRNQNHLQFRNIQKTWTPSYPNPTRIGSSNGLSEVPRVKKRSFFEFIKSSWEYFETFQCW